jgi:hypothetical protein
MKFIRDHAAIFFIVAIILIAISLFQWVRPRRSPAAKQAAKLYYENAAEQIRLAASHLDPDADVVLMIYDGEYQSMNKPHLKALFSVLKKEFNMTHVERLVYDETRGWTMAPSGFPYGEFLEVARAHPGAGAIISMCGAPYFSKGTQRADPASLPPLLVTRVDGLSKPLQALLEEGIVAVAVVPQEDSGGGVGGAEAFERVEYPHLN